MSQIKDNLLDLQTTIPIGNDNLAPVRDMLGSAAYAVNGTTEKIQAMSEVMGNMALVLGKLAIRETACPLHGAVNGKLAPLYPFRWPLCVFLTSIVIVMGGERVYNLISDRASLAACVQYETGIKD